MSRKNSKISVWLPLLLALFLAAGVLIGMLLGKPGRKPSMFIYPRTDKISTILNYIREEYVDSVDISRLEESTIVSLLSELDPHSVYIPAEDLQAVNEPLEGNFDGIGVQFNMPEDTVVIINTIPGGPSDKVGILAGDRIVRINDSLVAGVGIHQDDIVGMLKGPQGTRVKVGIKRKGVPDELTFEITRDKIPLYSVDVAYMVNDSTGFIKISKFARTTFNEFMDAASRLKEQGMTGLIIDLRGNSGGYMDAATHIADQFLSGGKMIVYTEGRARPRSEIRATHGGICLREKVVVLVDEFSASASEILAGAIQDNDRGMVVGRRTFGKGLVQEPILLADGSALRLTIARYYTPTGRSIQKPYSNGTEEYYNDWQTRYLHGEFTVRDSIRFADSLKYVTPGGNVVYGGGGIMPDVFVPFDTTGITDYFMQVSNRGLIYLFAFEYTDRYRNELTRFSDWKELNAYLNRQNLLQAFTNYTGRQGIEPKPSELQISGKIIHAQIKAYIARNILDNEGFYPIIHQIDAAFLKGKEVLETMM
ncbi:MAG TPA: S41 family peptidase [Bacteroidetes bacterium]|nr:S41 family peptidase [Bacteroidota bacterium]